MRRFLISQQDLLLGLGIVAAMSAAYLASGKFNIDARGSAADTAIIPVVSCVMRDPVNAGSFIAKFGYQRTGGAAVARVRYASNGASPNFVSVGGNPLSPDYGVPTEFAIGVHPNQFSVRALDAQTITWWLASDATRSAVATGTTQPVCPEH